MVFPFASVFLPSEAIFERHCAPDVHDDVEGKLLNRLVVGHILHLLEQGDPEHGRELFGRAPFAFIIL